MRPAFTSTPSAAAFALFVAALLVLPQVIGRTGWLAKSDVHVSRTWLHGPFPWNHFQIHNRREPVDIALLGSSRMWAGINAPLIEREFSARLGRKAEVISLGWNWAGFDSLHVVAADLLSHRKVGMIVILDEFDDREGAPHPCAHLWTPPGGDVPGTNELPWLDRLHVWAGAPLGLPKFAVTGRRAYQDFDSSMLSCTKTNGQYPIAVFNDIEPNLGSLQKEECPPGMGAFTPIEPRFDSPAPEVLRFSAGTRVNFNFTGPPSSTYQRDHLRALARLCHENGTRLVAVNMPKPEDRASPTIRERQVWSEFAGAPITAIGVPGEQLFRGLSELEVRRLYYDPVHLNANGSKRLTTLLAPALADILTSKEHVD